MVSAIDARTNSLTVELNNGSFRTLSLPVRAEVKSANQISNGKRGRVL
jgi:hypothetical protein